jgi:hypothetical protein
LLALGLVGDEFKTARLHLTAHLQGSAAWKHGRRDRRQSPDRDTTPQTTSEPEPARAAI